MALQQLLCVSTVTILLLCTGFRSAWGSVRNKRIAGGFPGSPRSFPWQVSLVSGGKHRCGGSLINDQWVMTAASCVTGSGSGVTVYLGRFNQSGSNPNEVSRTIAQAKCHPSYSTLTHENDICLLKLSSPVNFTKHIGPLGLADANSTVHSGEETTVAGWGNTSSFGASAFSTLQFAVLKIMGNKECQCNTTRRITDKMICTRAFRGRIDPCQGDAGSALRLPGSTRTIAIGIVSFGDGCAKPNVPGVSTRVSEYMEWISSSTGSDELGFEHFSSTGVDNDANVTCPTAAPPTASFTQTVFTNHTRPSTMPVNSTHPYTHPHTRPHTRPHTHPYTRPSTTNHSTTDDKSIFGGGENLIHFTHFTSLWVLALSVYVLVGHA